MTPKPMPERNDARSTPPALATALLDRNRNNGKPRQRAHDGALLYIVSLCALLGHASPELFCNMPAIRPLLPLALLLALPLALPQRRRLLLLLLLQRRLPPPPTFTYLRPPSATPTTTTATPRSYTLPLPLLLPLHLPPAPARCCYCHCSWYGCRRSSRCLHCWPRDHHHDNYPPCSFP